MSQLDGAAAGQLAAVGAAEVVRLEAQLTRAALERERDVSALAAAEASIDRAEAAHRSAERSLQEVSAASIAERDRSARLEVELGAMKARFDAMEHAARTSERTAERAAAAQAATEDSLRAAEEVAAAFRAESERVIDERDLQIARLSAEVGRAATRTHRRRPRLR